MEIIFLGTSSAVHSKERNHPSIAVKAFGEVMLFDCGEGTQKQLLFTKVSPMKISKIFITHYHGDHILGLPGLLQSMSLNGREEKLTVFGPKGLHNISDGIYSFGYCAIDFPVEFVVIVISNPSSSFIIFPLLSTKLIFAFAKGLFVPVSSFKISFTISSILCDDIGIR